MQKSFFKVAFIICLTNSLFAQNIVEKEPLQWYHGSHHNGIYGVNTDSAYIFLKQNKRTEKKSVIVAVLDSGTDYEHRDLKANMWINPNPNKNPKAPFYNAIYGWNFLGNTKGENQKYDQLESTRLYTAYKKLFEGPKRTQNIKKRPNKYKTYLETKKMVLEKQEMAKRQYDQITQIKTNFLEAISLVLSEVPGDSLKKEDLEGIEPKHQALIQAKLILMNFVDDGKTESKKNILNMLSKDIDSETKSYETKWKYLYNPDFDGRALVNDDPNNINDRNYGNPDVKGPSGDHGTHVAGIVAGKQNDSLNIRGIAPMAKIMAIRAVPDGDERDKDIANGIYFAVDNGAKIINMSFGKGFSPEKKWVDDAFRYAEQKGVLLVHAAGNDSKNIDIVDNFPNTRDLSGKPFSNLITVGASTKNKDALVAYFSNYGKNSVDLFAPGMDIYAPTPNNNYKSNSGTSMAAPVVSGVAALLWTYYPELSYKEVREIIMSSVNKPDFKVPIPTKDNQENEILKKVSLKELSISGGVVDALKAVKLAEKRVSSK